MVRSAGTLGFLSLLTLSCVSAPRDLASLPNRRPLLVLASTDFHGALEGRPVRTRSGISAEIAGARGFAALHRGIRALATRSGITTVAVDAGDVFQGTLASNLFEGKPVIELYNAIGIDAVALGNHDFDYGPEGKASVPQRPKDNARGALEARMRESRFAWLGANVGGGGGFFRQRLVASHIVARDGLKIGIIGLAGEDTAQTTDRRNIEGLNFGLLRDAVARESTRLKREGGVDYIVVVAHAGGGCDDNRPEKVDDLSSCPPQAGILGLARDLPRDTADVYVGGHTHKGIYKRVNGSVVVQPFSNAAYLGAVWVGGPLPANLPAGIVGVCSHTRAGSPIDAQCAKPNLENADQVAPMTIAGQSVQTDPDLDRKLAPYLDRARKQGAMPLGVRSPQILTRSFNSESLLGDLMADVAKASHPEVDLVVFNNGGFRADLPAGDWNYGHLYSVFPFDSYLAVVELKGSELIRAIKLGLVKDEGARSWGGLRFRSRDCVIEAELTTGPVDLARTYRILTTDYLATGGSGFDRLKLDKVTLLTQLPNQREIMIDMLRKQKSLIENYRFEPRQQVEGALCDPKSI